MTYSSSMNGMGNRMISSRSMVHIHRLDYWWTIGGAREERP